MAKHFWFCFLEELTVLVEIYKTVSCVLDGWSGRFSGVIWIVATTNSHLSM